jgi:phosphatidylglycerophosphate synthase
MDHIREHRSILAAAEKRLLVGIARRLPASVNSDHLSALALAAMLGAGAAFALIGTASWAAPTVVLCLLVNWFGDSLDGTVARVRDQQRPRYGYYVDHVIDLAGTAALIGGMAVSGVMTPALGFALLAAYYLASAESFLGTHARGLFRMSFAGFGPTELRIVLGAGALRVAAGPVVVLAGHSVYLLDAGAAVAIAGLGIAFAAAAVRNGIALYRSEPLPPRGRRPSIRSTPLPAPPVSVGATVARSVEPEAVAPCL